MPPAAWRVCEYAVPTTPFARDVVVTVSTGGAIVRLKLALAVCADKPESVTLNVSGRIAEASSADGAGHVGEHQAEVELRRVRVLHAARDAGKAKTRRHDGAVKQPARRLDPARAEKAAHRSPRPS